MDDTTRGVRPGDDLRGRGEETTRDYASPAEPAGASGATRSSEPVRSTNRGASADLDPDSERRTRQLQSEIASTREEMSETIDALQEKLRPGNLVSDATERVKGAASERMRSMTDMASEKAQGVIQEVRQNPIPALMIGAGVAWMLIDYARQQDDGYRRRPGWSEYSTSRYGAYSEADESYRSSSATGRSWNRLGAASEGIGSWAREAGTEARTTARRAQNGLERLMHDNPLLVGAAAMLVGAAIGASLPETERENEWLGEARDTVVDRAQELARNATDAVKDAANSAVGDTVAKVAERVTTGKESS